MRVRCNSTQIDKESCESTQFSDETLYVDHVINDEIVGIGDIYMHAASNASVIKLVYKLIGWIGGLERWLYIKYIDR